MSGRFQYIGPTPNPVPPSSSPDGAFVQPLCVSFQVREGTEFSCLDKDPSDTVPTTGTWLFVQWVFPSLEGWNSSQGNFEIARTPKIRGKVGEKVQDRCLWPCTGP